MQIEAGNAGLEQMSQRGRVGRAHHPIRQAEAAHGGRPRGGEIEPRLVDKGEDDLPLGTADGKQPSLVEHRPCRGCRARSGAVGPSVLWNKIIDMYACHKLGNPLLKARILLRELLSP